MRTSPELVQFLIWSVVVLGGCNKGGGEGPSDTGTTDMGEVDLGSDTGIPDMGAPDIGRDMGEPDLNHDEALEALGASLQLGPRLDPEGMPIREDYNPFGKSRRTLHRLSESYLLGVSLAGTAARQALIDDASGEHATLYSDPADDAWAMLPKAAAAGDIDGDAREEALVLLVNNNVASSDYKRVYLRVLEDAEDGYATDEIELTILGELAPVDHWDWMKIDVAAGDIDGDGRDEIVAAAFGTVWVVDDASGNYQVLFAQSFPAAAGVEQYVRVAVGDVDADGLDDLVVVDGQVTGATGTAMAHVYNESFTVDWEGNVQVSIDAVPYQLATADLSIGDVDGDGLNEVVFVGRQTGTNTSVVLVMDDAKAGYEFLPLRYNLGFTLPFVRTETGDFDGDGFDEIVAYREIIDDVRSASGGLLQRQSLIPYDILYTNSMSVGDVTNDWRDDIIYINGGADFWVRAWGTDSAGVYRQMFAFNTTNEVGNFPVVTTVNTDGDSAILEFIDTEVLFTEPRILAVLAAPPSFADIPMDLGSAGTSFGQGSSMGVETEKSIGFSTGFSVGTEFEDRLFSQSKARFSVTVETSMDWTATSSREVQKSYFYNGTGETDKVVFATVPFDVYYYRVLSSPIEAEVGTTMIVNLPREPQILFVDRDFYNANNGRFLDIGPSVLSHEIGAPGSYPAKATIDTDALVRRGGAYSDEMTVGEGPGSQTIEIVVSEGKGAGANFDLSVTTEYEVGSGGFFAGGSIGFHYGFGYRITSSASTIYSGTVGNIIAPAEWVEHRFDFGLFVDPVSLEGQRFPLINYWVD